MTTDMPVKIYHAATGEHDAADVGFSSVGNILVMLTNIAPRF